MSAGFGGDMVPKKLSAKQLIDAGSALVLILLIIGFLTRNTLFYKLAIPALLINMTFPKFYYPFGIFWYGLSNLLGYVVSRILLTIVYVIMVIPVGLFRRLIGKDPLYLNRFKKGHASTLKIRDYTFSSKDITNPY
jgi:hypothetical protein